MKRDVVLVVALVAALVRPAPAAADLSREALARIGVHAPTGAAEPPALRFTTVEGRTTTLGEAIDGRPTLLVFEDFRCRTLCGPALTIAASTMTRSGLRLGRDLRLVSIGLRPGEPVGEARAFRDAHLAGEPGVLAASTFLVGDADAVRRATGAVGFGYAYDPTADQFAHPIAIFVLSPDGKVVRTLEQTALDPASLRGAVAAAAADRPGDLIDHLALLCHGLWPASGRYDGAVRTMLRVLALACVAAMAAGLILLSRRRRVA